MHTTIFVSLLLVLGCQLALAGPPAWQCGTQVDYWAKSTTVCAAGDCNAAQRNIGGDILVLDTKSYGQKACQGCNPDVPATCCQACKDKDDCNAWVVCTNKDGCGDGCQAYAKQFKGPVSYEERLPHKFWGNWGGCNGDKWPFGMCSLKVVKDTSNPPVTSSKASDGWVSGIVPKVAADGRCPATLSAKSCKMCLATKDPALCIKCIQAANRLDGPAMCTSCASLATHRDTCVACVSGSNAAECSQCLDADCDTSCINARMADRSKAPNLGAADKCFACQVAAAKAAGGASSTKVSTERGSKAGQCAKCFDAGATPAAAREQCIAGVVAPSASAASAVAAAECAGAYIADKTKCLACGARAKTEAEARGCASCSMPSVPGSFVDGCFKCVLATPDDGAKGYCSNLERDTNEAAVAAFYRCLAGAKGPDAPSSCWQCYRSGSDASAAKCYECMDKVSSGNGIHCSHCWVPSRMASNQAGSCEACVVSKDKAKGNAGDCWAR